MTFTVEALNARHGDCLLLHYGPADAPGLMLVDGGPAGVYRRTLRPRLRALAEQRNVDELPIDMVLVSHIDDDHIRGIMDLMDELVEATDELRPVPFIPERLWHNSFDDVIGNLDPGLAALRGESTERTRAVAASVDQGRRLRRQADRLAVPVNRPFPGIIARGAPGGPSVRLPGELTLTVLAPAPERLEQLQREWDEELRRLQRRSAGAAAEAAALLDRTATNLSSLVILAEHDGHTVLLTGDARGDDVTEGVSEAGLLVDGRVHVDVLKVPHHGSARSLDEDFFRTVTADHYVISADGRHGNPDLESLHMLAAARQDDAFTLHLTNREERLTSFAEEQRAAGRSFAVRFRKPDDLSIAVQVGAVTRS
ncbi:ComEC/Rec2 family competence protein [Streptomyces sp. NPDC001663]|uniref:ComEC/Rec2 family competence protein n=1 Tax=Streptomyces sp. NPDC001663 TaxID=3364597 RepID=UPI0036B47FBD